MLIRTPILLAFLSVLRDPKYHHPNELHQGFVNQTVLKVCDENEHLKSICLQQVGICFITCTRVCSDLDCIRFDSRIFFLLELMRVV